MARSAFSSQNVPNTSGSEQFLKLRCRKIARRCGAKRIFNSKCTKHLRLGAIFEVTMSKNCTSLWHEAHFQFKIIKAPQARSNFWSYDVEKLDAAVKRSTFSIQNHKNWRSLNVEHSFFDGTRLWREAHVQVKMYRIPMFWHTFWSSGVEELVS